MELELNKLSKQVCDLAREVGKFQVSQIKKVTHRQVEDKEHNSLVSYVDKHSEKMIVDTLSQLLPEAGFITEEDIVVNEEKELTWIIDPLDGTTNYLHGIPHYCVSIALKHQSEIILGVVHEPNRNECFNAIKNGGAFINNDSIFVNKKDTISNCIIATGFPYKNDYAVKPLLKLINHWLMKTRGVRRFGSAALDLAFVAAGRYDLYYEGFLNAWDFAAGALIVKEAGGIVTDYNGNSAFLENGSIIASAKGIYNEVATLIGDYAEEQSI